MNPTQKDRNLHRITRGTVILIFILTAFALFLAPIQAIQWRRQPFPGFLVEHTLVIPVIKGSGWSGLPAGLDYPQRITHIDGKLVRNSGEYTTVINTLSIGQRIQVRTIFPDGTTRLNSGIEVMRFPTRDLWRLFWLPYIVGLAYFALGLWVYAIRRDTRPGRVFAFFSASAALTISLTFDLSTTHLASIFWQFIIPQLGGALISMALLFPETWVPLRRRAWLRFTPYLLGLLLTAWGLILQQNSADPWAYVRAWQINYIYTAMGIALFLGMALYRQARSISPVIRQQARIILWGSLFAFLPVGIWFAGPIFNLTLEWNPLIILPSLLLFPLAIGIAMLRYRLWDLEVIINRTLVYGVLTVLIGLVYYTLVLVFEQVFSGFMLQTNPVLIAGSTLVIAALFNPVRNVVQTFIDRRFFRQKYDTAQTVAAFGSILRNEVDLENLRAGLVSVIQDTMQPTQTTLCSCLEAHPLDVFLINEDDPLKAHLLRNNEPVETGKLDLSSLALQELRSKNIELIVPLVSQNELVGIITLGPRRSEQSYSIDDRRFLSMLASQAAPALRMAEIMRQQQVEALERQRMENELRVANLIQHTLLPKELPQLPGWQFEGYYQPARAVGGDFYDLITLPDGCLGIVIGDATDKGVPASLVMATTRSLIRTNAVEVLSPAEVLRLVNSHLKPDIPDNMFVTCLYLVLNQQTGQIRMANAGHNPPYLLRGGIVTSVKATGMPLGIFIDASYDEIQLDMLPGDKLLLYSDGLLEAHNPQGEMLGFQGMKTLVENIPQNSNMIEHLIASFNKQFNNGLEQEDDITLVTIERIISAF